MTAWITAQAQEETRLELGGGLLTLGILLNQSDYLLCTDTNLALKQNISAETGEYVQGGDFASISSFLEKKIEGSLSFPLLLEGDGTVNPAVRFMMQAAQNPQDSFRIDTNYTFSHLGLSCDDPATTNNALIGLDCCVIEELTLSCAENEQVKISVKIAGMIDLREASAFVDVPDEYLLTADLRRQADFRDCDAWRVHSDLRTMSSLEITIENQLEKKAFLPAWGTSVEDRDDQISIIAPKGRKWSGSYKEQVPRGWGKTGYSHGGWMVNENLVLSFGPIKATIAHPLFEASNVPVTATKQERDVRFTSIQSPSYTGNLFTFS